MTIRNSKIYEKGILADSLISDLQLFFVDYFKQKFTLDSIKKVKELERAKNEVQILVLDGITVNGVLVDKYTERSFNFWSPQGGSNDQKLIGTLYKLLYNTFTKPETITYLEQLEGYFAFGLGLRKLKESPLTYKIYGSITSNEENELLDFFSSLPADKEVYFDMSNFNGMGTMFYDDFYTLCNKNRRIFWIDCSDSAKDDLTKAGIRSTNIR